MLLVYDMLKSEVNKISRREVNDGIWWRINQKGQWEKEIMIYVICHCNNYEPHYIAMIIYDSHGVTHCSGYWLM